MALNLSEAGHGFRRTLGSLSLARAAPTWTDSDHPEFRLVSHDANLPRRRRRVRNARFLANGPPRGMVFGKYLEIQSKSLEEYARIARIGKKHKTLHLRPTCVPTKRDARYRRAGAGAIDWKCTQKRKMAREKIDKRRFILPIFPQRRPDSRPIISPSCAFSRALITRRNRKLSKARVTTCRRKI